jgi:peptidoglycan/xylan/chitin deacetylase (PgdA/CDA1 family)
MAQRTRTITLAIFSLALFLMFAPAPTIADTDQPPSKAPGEMAVAAPPACPDRAAIPRTVPPADRVTLPILMYHHVKHLAANANAIWRNLTVTPEAFEAQIKYLADNGYHSIYFSDLVAYFDQGTPLPDNPIILTFDDGWIEQYTVVYPVLRKYCMVGTFFPPVNWVNNGKGVQVISWPMIEEMSNGGMEFGSHTLNHHLLNNQTALQIMEQLVDSKAELEKHTVRPVVALAYPGGGHNPLAVSLVPKADYGAAVGVTASLEQARTDLFLLHRITIPYSDDLNTFGGRIRPKNPMGVAASQLPRLITPPSSRSMRWPDRWEDLASR